MRRGAQVSHKAFYDLMAQIQEIIVENKGIASDGRIFFVYFGENRVEWENYHKLHYQSELILQVYPYPSDWTVDTCFKRPQRNTQPDQVHIGAPG
jgi:hypothetical protein